MAHAEVVLRTEHYTLYEQDQGPNFYRRSSCNYCPDWQSGSRSWGVSSDDTIVDEVMQHIIREHPEKIGPNGGA